MPDAKQQALSIYETLCATSADRPFAFRSAEQMHREIAAWQTNNPGLKSLRHASPDVLLAFLSESVQWLQAEAKEHSNFRAASTLLDAILYSLNEAPQPLPAELVLKLLTEIRQSTVMRFYFPLHAFLSVLTRDQVTSEIREELRKLHLHYAPSPTGKMDERTEKMRNQLAELIYIEGQKGLEPGRGPWSQIVFEEIAARDSVSGAAWRGLLEHVYGLQQAVPSAKNARASWSRPSARPKSGSFFNAG